MRKMVLDALIETARMREFWERAVAVDGDKHAIAMFDCCQKRLVKFHAYIARILGECEWEEHVSMDSHTGEQSELYVTACGQEWNAACNWAWSPHWDNVFCPYCGRRIGVKEDA